MVVETTLTRRKQRLPRGWSYPVSARDVEGRVGATSGPDEFSLYFIFRSYSLRASEHLALLRAGKHIPVLEAWYSNPKSTIPSTALSRKPMSAVEPKWSIYVCAIPSQARHVCREALVSDGLQAIHRWLAAERRSTWYRGCKTLTVRVVPDTGALE